MRLSGQDFTESPNFAPRLNLSYALSPFWDLSVGYGWFYQPDQFFDLRAEIGQASLSQRNAEAVHYTANLTFRKKAVTMRLDLYHKDYRRLLDDFRFTPTERIEIFKSFEDRHGTVKGSSTGFELGFNYQYGNHLLNLNYAYNHSIIVNDANIETSRTGEIPHSFTLNNLLQFSRDFRISSSLIIHSGTPYSQLSGASAIRRNQGTENVTFYRLESKNTLRHPTYKTLDLRFSKEWTGKKTKVEAYLNILNLFNSRNIRNFYYDSFTRSNGDIDVFLDDSPFFPFFITPGFKITF